MNWKHILFAIFFAVLSPFLLAYGVIRWNAKPFAPVWAFIGMLGLSRLFLAICRIRDELKRKK